MLIGLNQLERVVIGMNSFTKQKNREWPSYNPNRHFYLKNCERVRELKIGCDSFRDYTVCVIENVPSLEVIEMGGLNRDSSNFCYASLELKSDCERMKWWIDMPSLKSLLFGNYAFCCCSRAVFESDSTRKREWWIDLPELTSIQLSWYAFCFKNDESSELVMRSGDDEMKWWIDLPKLTSLTGSSGTFEYPRSITLEGTSYHSILTNRHALSHYCLSSWCIWV